MVLTTGTKLGSYEILSVLGAGGMGEVYRARDTALGRDVALKILRPGAVQDADRLRRFRQEAQAAAALNHPNIMAIHFVGEHDGTPYIVAELLEGESLRECLRAGALPVRKCMDYALQIAEGLAAAHEKGVIHRDLKPENIFITKDGRVRILDFGLAKLTRPDAIAPDASSLTLTQGSTQGVVLGTVGYMSPEQVRGKPLDSRSDIFSLGVILCEMLSGKNFFLRNTAADTMSAILKEDVPELVPSVQGVSPSTGSRGSPASRERTRSSFSIRPRPRFRAPGSHGKRVILVRRDSTSAAAHCRRTSRLIEIAFCCRNVLLRRWRRDLACAPGWPFQPRRRNDDHSSI